MKKIVTYTLTGLLVGLFQLPANAQVVPAITNIDINNIDAAISAANDLFWDFSNAHFYVPKGGQTQAIFAGGMWIGGFDSGGQVRMAASTYRQTGWDFEPGPIDTIGGLSPANPLDWNTSWKLTAAEVLDHRNNYTNPNYVVPANIAAWPGYDTSLQRVLAPFADYNGNGIYDPANGDYPYILGDMTVYSIYNDLGTHTETTCGSLGFEIHRTFWGFDAPVDTALNNTIFCRYEIKNFTSETYSDVYANMWMDFELGNAVDDYVGTDIGLNMIYAYNGDSIDETPPYGYGLNPPAIGVYFLNQPLAASMTYDNVNNIPYGNPGGCYDFYNYTHAIWLDNQPLTYGGNGRDPSNPITTYAYSGDTDTALAPVYGPWTEALAGNTPDDRRMMGAAGPFAIPPGGYLSFDVGYTWARASSGGPLASVAELQNAVNNLRLMYDNGVLTGVRNPAVVAGKCTLYPNPATDRVAIQIPVSAADGAIRVYNAIGQAITAMKVPDQTRAYLDIQNYPAGIYFVEIVYNNKRETLKLIVR